MSETFNPQDYMMAVRKGGKSDYLPVAARVYWFRLEHPLWGIESEAVTIQTVQEGCPNPYAIFKATIKDETGRILSQAHKMEDLKGFGDFAEKAETGAIGRALASLGFGTIGAFDFVEGVPIDAPTVPVVTLTYPTEEEKQAFMSRIADDLLAGGVLTKGDDKKKAQETIKALVYALSKAPEAEELATQDYEAAIASLPNYIKTRKAKAQKAE